MKGSLYELKRSIFKKWVQWSDIILLSLQPSNNKRNFLKRVTALTNDFQQTMNNPKIFIISTAILQIISVNITEVIYVYGYIM